MNNQIFLQLKSKLDEVNARGVEDAETKRNALKEELQYYVLNFIYHHPEFSNWTMYGGSALRICHKLDRMSIDLDFEIEEEITHDFLEKLKLEMENYFIKTYAVNLDFVTIKINNNRGIRINFNIGKELGLGHISDMIHIKIDLNHFISSKITTEKIPINYNQFSFVIKTYNMSNLMSSKIAAIFLRGERGVGNVFYEEKGRDIYDLIWYMNQKIIPDLDYLKGKGVPILNIRDLFDKLTFKMNKVNENNLKNDLMPLFFDQTFILNWLKNWLDSYLYLLKGYKINTISNIEKIKISQNLQTDNFSFAFFYKIVDGKQIRVICNLSDYWLDIDIPNSNIDLDHLLDISEDMWIKDGKSIEKIKKYVKLFYLKIERYFKKTNKVMIGDIIITKLIRMTADNLDRSEQIVLTPSALESCELDDLFK